ncbi:MAG: SsrA-binding protein SmpB [Dehalococcoidia bacterium]|jgi:SsrA-binding protein|nr:SsrA-binding protein SmpB [Dehalococcoidia bacterium]
MPEKEEKTITFNRKALHDYHILKTMEAGIELKGTEVKSIRDGRVNIRDAYVRPEGGEMWLVGAHIAHYPPAGRFQHDPYRKRRLLLHRRQIRELVQALRGEGMTIVPLRIYFRGGRAKVEIALAKGKRQYDKRAALARREAERRMREALRRLA